jgi:hypothetical protein
MIKRGSTMYCSIPIVGLGFRVQGWNSRVTHSPIPEPTPCLFTVPYDKAVINPWTQSYTFIEPVLDLDAYLLTLLVLNVLRTPLVLLVPNVLLVPSAVMASELRV